MTAEGSAREPAACGEHILRLFDTQESLAGVVTTFLCEGWAAGDHLLVVAKPRHWITISRRMRRRRVPIADAVADGRLVVLDARTTLSSILKGERPDAGLFHATVGAMVTSLAPRDRTRLRVYGEMVEIAAEEGNFDAACDLEDLWNGLRRQLPLTLLCGYSAAHFTDVRAADALHNICRRHTRVCCDPGDMLGTWLLGRGRPDAAGAP